MILCLEEDTGLPYRQLRNRVAIARAMGLFNEKSLVLTPFGKLVVKHDIFFENIGTLEYCHFLAAGNFFNLVWYDVFNELLVENPPADYQGWMRFFKQKYEGLYTQASIEDHLSKEVRFTIEAYLKNRFRKLDLLAENSSGQIQKRRHVEINPLILTAMICKFMSSKSITLIQVEELVSSKGSPGILYGIDGAAFRSHLEMLHEQNLLRLETRHGLDQIRIKDGTEPENNLNAFYTGLNPMPSVQDNKDDEGLLL